MRKTTLALFAALSAFMPAVADASPSAPAVRDANGLVIQAEGWWEQSHHVEILRDRYWRLPPHQRDRYDQLQSQIQQLQEEQHRILRFGDWDRRIHEGPYYRPNPPPPPGYHPGYGPN